MIHRQPRPLLVKRGTGSGPWSGVHCHVDTRTVHHWLPRRLGAEIHITTTQSRLDNDNINVNISCFTGALGF